MSFFHNIWNCSSYCIYSLNTGSHFLACGLSLLGKLLICHCGRLSIWLPFFINDYIINNHMCIGRSVCFVKDYEFCFRGIETLLLWLEKSSWFLCFPFQNFFAIFDWGIRCENDCVICMMNVLFRCQGIYACHFWINWTAVDQGSFLEKLLLWVQLDLIESFIYLFAAFFLMFCIFTYCLQYRR